MKAIVSKTISTTAKLLVVAILSSCAMGIKGKGQVERTVIEPESFTYIEVSGFFNVHYRQGPIHEVTLVTHENISEYVTITIDDNEISAEISDKVSDADKLDLFITSPVLESIRISGACDFESANTIAGDYLSIRGSGASEVDAEVRVSKLEIRASGASELDLSGRVQMAKIDVSGATSIDAYELEADRCKISTSGASEIKIHATQELIVNASGASSISYKGNPAITEDLSGAASINSVR